MDAQLTIIKLLLWKGLIPTITLIPITVAFSLCIGIVGGAIRVVRLPYIDGVLRLYIYVMRGLPMLVLLLFVYYALGIGQDPMIAAVGTLSIYNGAYMIEICRGGFESVPKGQWEAAHALGMNYWEKMRFVILPQALIVMTPALIGQIIILVKETAVVSLIGYVELTRMARNIMQAIMMPVAIFAYIAIMYFIVCHALKMVANYFERMAYVKMGFKK